MVRTYRDVPISIQDILRKKLATLTKFHLYLHLLCYLHTVCSDGDVRLMNGSVSTSDSGRVEVCLDNAYGAVCNTHWDELDAIVVCRQLGLPASSKSAVVELSTALKRCDCNLCLMEQ